MRPHPDLKPIRREDLTDQEWQAFSNLCAVMRRLKAKVRNAAA